MRGEKTEGDNEGGVSEEGGTSREIERRDITLRNKKKKEEEVGVEGGKKVGWGMSECWSLRNSRWSSLQLSPQQ